MQTKPHSAKTWLLGVWAPTRTIGDGPGRSHMYDRDNYELAMYALDEGMRASEVARVVSASRETVRRWRLGVFSQILLSV